MAVASQKRKNVFDVFCHIFTFLHLKLITISLCSANYNIAVKRHSTCLHIYDSFGTYNDIQKQLIPSDVPAF